MTITVRQTAEVGVGDLLMTVTGSRMVCDGVREIDFAAVSGRRLRSFAPGSHIGVQWAPGLRNSYSLIGPTFEPEEYSICVRRDDVGRGGSMWLHGLDVGEQVVISEPRSDFAPVSIARHHLLIAGGIGVTPILSHVRAAVQWNRSFEVIYTHRRGAGPLTDVMRELCGERLTIVEGAGGFWDRFRPRLTDSPLGTHVYTCGPTSLIDDVAAAAQAAGWPSARVHSEKFAAGAVVGGEPFAARLGRSGVLVPVDGQVSLLEALTERGVAVPNLCRQGVCGECRIGVRGGAIDHRDSYLTDDERAAGEVMMPCVSRALGDHLELDL